MVLSKIENKEIELFTENEVRVYTRNIDIPLFDMLKVYFNSDGFAVFENENNSIFGYLDKSDIKMLRGLFGEYKDKVQEISIRELVEKNKMQLRDLYFSYNHSLLYVLQEIDQSSQIYFPVVKNNFLLGRVSKSIIRERIQKLY